MKRLLIPVFIASILLVSRAGAADSSVALQSAQEKFDAKEYTETLRIISRELTSTAGRRDAAPVPQRYELLMLKGEAMLRLDQRASAAAAFEQAEKSAPDAKAAAIASANMLLTKASPMNKFTPKDRAAGAIDILDPESRKKAFAAMQRDKADELAPRLAKARESKTLPPMIAVIEPLFDIAQLEYAATGAASTTGAQIGELREHAQKMINEELRRLHYRVNALSDAANSAAGSNWDEVNRRGLFSQEKQEVQEMVKYLKQIERTCRDARKRGLQIGSPFAETWTPIGADAADLADRADALLNIAP